MPCAVGGMHGGPQACRCRPGHRDRTGSGRVGRRALVSLGVGTLFVVAVRLLAVDLRLDEVWRIVLFL